MKKTYYHNRCITTRRMEGVNNYILSRRVARFVVYEDLNMLNISLCMQYHGSMFTFSNSDTKASE